MRFKYRIVLIVGIYLLLLFCGFIVEYNFDKQLAPDVFKNPTLSIKTFLDDFIIVTISGYWNQKQVNFVVIDEFGNIMHNSTSTFDCEGYKKINLQGSPQDYPKDRKYRVEAFFDNQSISSNYFYLANCTGLCLVKNEFNSFFYFMIYQSRLARGSYSDYQRLMYVDTKDPVYAERFIKAHALGLISTLNILLAIDIAIWIFVLLKFGADKARGKKPNLGRNLSGHRS
jgi:hypothetical protein